MLLRTHNVKRTLDPVTPDEWRQAVGAEVERRRRDLYPSRRQAAAGSGVSEIVWRQIETGRRQLAPEHVVAPNPEQQTKEAIGRRLWWSSDSIDRLLRGDPPIEVERPDRQDGQGQPGDRLDRLEKAVDRLTDRFDRLSDLVERAIRERP